MIIFLGLLMHPALILGVILVQQAFRTPKIIYWRLLVLSVLCWLPFWYLNYDALGQGLARSYSQTYANLLAWLILLLGMLWLIRSLPGWHKLSSLILLLVIIGMELVIIIPSERALIKELSCALTMNATRIETYKQQQHVYPESARTILALPIPLQPECVPYRNNNPWIMYTPTQESYVLGIWSPASYHDLGHWVCQYHPDTKQVDCRLNDWTAFPAELRPSFTPGQP